MRLVFVLAPAKSHCSPVKGSTEDASFLMEKFQKTGFPKINAIMKCIFVKFTKSRLRCHQHDFASCNNKWSDRHKPL